MYAGEACHPLGCQVLCNLKAKNTQTESLPDILARQKDDLALLSEETWKPPSEGSLLQLGAVWQQRGIINTPDWHFPAVSPLENMNETKLSWVLKSLESFAHFNEI